MTKNDLYRLFGESVKYSPPNEDRSQQLQTFAVLRSENDLIAESLGRSVLDRGKPFFYSRKWAASNYNANVIEYEYPGLFALDLSPQLNGFFNKSGERSETITIRLYCLYPNVERLEDDTIKSLCKNILTDEIYLLTKGLLKSSLYYIQDSIYANTNVDATYRWYNKGYLDYLVTSGDIATYTENKESTLFFQNRLRQNNAGIQGNHIDDLGIHKLTGVYFDLSFYEIDCKKSYDFEFSNKC